MDALKRLRAVVCFFVLLLANTASGKPVVYVDGVDPLAYSEDGRQQGLLHELLSEMARRVHHSGPISPMPLKRQRVLLREHCPPPRQSHEGPVGQRPTAK